MKDKYLIIYKDGFIVVNVNESLKLQNDPDVLQIIPMQFIIEETFLD